jgi:tRNA-specific adenosine deaminase 2
MDQSNEESFLQDALEEANKAYLSGEVPVGCVIVYKDEIVGRGHNETVRSRNPTRHAEFVAMDQVLTKYKESVFLECDLYVTIEPCIMCASALKVCGFRSIHCCVGNDKFGGCGSVLNLISCGYHPNQKAIDLLQEFYKGENKSIL